MWSVSLRAHVYVEHVSVVMAYGTMPLPTLLVPMVAVCILKSVTRNISEVWRTH